MKGDVGSGEFDDLPSDFTYVVHLAANQSPGWDYDTALRDNAEGTGLLLQHCRNARGALVMSTHSVYRPQEDPMYVFTEESPLGECNSTHSPTYSVSKIGQEATARLAARAFGVPVTIARMNASYGPNGGLPALHVDAIAAGRQVTTRWDPCMYSPIFEDDINLQVSSLLQAATVPRDHRQLGRRRTGQRPGVGGIRRRVDGRRCDRRCGPDRGDTAGFDRGHDSAHVHHRAMHGGLARGPPPDSRSSPSGQARRDRTLVSTTS